MRGVILESFPQGESNRFYKIFTDELGLVGATAQSVREGRSKLRYVLQDYSWVRLDLVRGKELWRIVSALTDEERSQAYANPEAFRVFARITSVVARFVQGELPEDGILTDLCGAHSLLCTGALSRESFAIIEALAVLRVLSRLGYCNEPMLNNFLKDDLAWSQKTLEEFDPFQKHAILSINKAFRESHL